MLIRCAQCGKKHRLDPIIITGPSASFHCKACQHIIEVVKPDPIEGDPDASALLDPDSIEDSIGNRDDRQSPPSQDRDIGKIETGPEQDTTGSASEKEPTAERPGARSGARGSRLTAKLILQMLVVSLLPLAIFWGLTFKQTSEQAKRDFDTLTAEITSCLAALN